jgi:hypothetical protein
MKEEECRGDKKSREEKLCSVVKADLSLWRKGLSGMGLCRGGEWREGCGCRCGWWLCFVFGGFGLSCLALRVRLLVVVLRVGYKRYWNKVMVGWFVDSTYPLRRVLLVSHLPNRFLLGSGMFFADEMKYAPYYTMVKTRRRENETLCSLRKLVTMTCMFVSLVIRQEKYIFPLTYSFATRLLTTITRSQYDVAAIVAV